jgi:hypothetical protein
VALLREATRHPLTYLIERGATIKVLDENILLLANSVASVGIQTGIVLLG